MHEVLSEVVGMMQNVANGEPERRASGYHWIRHGAREAIVVDDYYSAYPHDLPAGATKEGVKFGAIAHDIGKTTCVTNPGIWQVIDWKITPAEWKEIASHVPATIKLLAAYQKDSGIVIPTEGFVYAAYHHEKLDGSGYLGIKADALPHSARLAAVIDQIVSRCENREYRYGRPPASFVGAFREVDAGRGTLYDPEILDKVWKLYEDNPLIYSPGNQWIFQNGHLHRI